MNLKPFVNDKHLWDDFLEELEDRLKKVHNKFELAQTEKDLWIAQGEAKAIRSLKQLRDKVNGG